MRSLARIVFVVLAAAPMHAVPQAGPVAPRAQGAPQVPEDSVAKLARWVKRWSDPRALITPLALRELEPLVAELRMLQQARPERRHDVFLALLDVAALAPRRPVGARAALSTAPLAAATPREQASEQAFEALARVLDLDTAGELPAWIAGTLLAQPVPPPQARRRATLELLAGRFLPATLLAVMGCARDEQREIRDAAMAALAGWCDDGVHRFMLLQLARARREAAWIAPAQVLAHFASVPLAAGSEGSRAVFEFVRGDVLSNDWRCAVRALRLLQTVDDGSAIPALIEALSVWIARREEGRGSRRIEDELHRQLKQRSGKTIGPFPGRWATWWKARNSGRLPAEPENGPRQVTRAGFFGLRPITDRVTFIVDRSGSMEAPFASAAATRYHEALRQMTAFLRDLGPQTRFRIVLFESSVHVWKDQLQLASAANLAAAEAWVGYQHPDGGTVLRPAVEQVLRVRRGGGIDLHKLEEDTVIVLCDGATTDGPSWVEPLLTRVGDDACVVFHCVQIGAGGDGTLEALARLTGGEFLRVDG